MIDPDNIVLIKDLDMLHALSPPPTAEDSAIAMVVVEVFERGHASVTVPVPAGHEHQVYCEVRRLRGLA